MGRFSGDILDRTFQFGVRIVRMATTLPRNPGIAVLVRQVIASGTAVGANLREANHAETRKSFVNHVAIALKECCEAIYWLHVIVGAGIAARQRMEPLAAEGREIEKILATIVRKAKQRTGAETGRGSAFSLSRFFGFSLSATRRRTWLQSRL